MARGAKLNEGQTHAQYVAGERHGTKATAKHVRFSATKARVVLDLVRGLPVKRADEVLQFTERGAAHDVRKVLASAVANASDTNNAAYLGDADELFVLACFADEGATLRRFRPRARGRATTACATVCASTSTTCHITVVVARMSDQRLAIEQARGEGASANSAASRRARVERSRQRAEAARSAATTTATDETPADEVDDEVVEAIGVHATDPAEGKVDVEAADDGAAEDGAADDGAAEDDAADGAQRSDDSAFEQGEWEGSVLPDDDGNGPATHPIKGNADSMLYHEPDSRYYAITKAEVWFDTAEHAEAAGFSKPASAEKSED